MEDRHAADPLRAMDAEGNGGYALGWMGMMGRLREIGLRLPKHRARVVVEQHPQRVDAQRGAEGQQRNIQKAEQQRDHATPWLVIAERLARRDMNASPPQRNDRQSPEHRGGQSGSE